MGEIEHVFRLLSDGLEKEDWLQVAETLERVSEVGEKNGRRVISIQAQSLRFSIESRVSALGDARGIQPEIEWLFRDLKEHLRFLGYSKGEIPSA